MKLFAIALLFASSVHAADVVGLGVGASKANEAIVRIDGKATTVRLDGVPDASDAAREFLQCLLAGRVVHVDVAHGRVTMLDGNSANDHVLEYLQTKTKVDPCQLGKAAYVRGTAPTAVAPTPGAAPAEIEPIVTSEQLPQPKPAKPPAAKKKPKAKKH